MVFLRDGAVVDRLLRAPAHEIAERMTGLTARTPAPPAAWAAEVPGEAAQQRTGPRRRPFQPSAFAGTFIALAVAAAIVSACGILLETGIRASAPPQRYAGAPVVIAADQRVHYVIGHGDGRSDESEQVPDRARLDASLVATAAPRSRGRGRGP
ncbi:hypothetical protein SANTM175S_08778 [Streptomyces antimycoticus]